MESSQTSGDALQQARCIHETLRVLRRHMMARHSLAALRDGGKTACPELTMPQIEAMMAIHDRGQVTIKELARALDVSAPSASSMVDRLVDVGALTREQSKLDRREVVVRLSPDAVEHMDAMERHILQSIVVMIEKIGPEYARMWCEVYEKLREAVGEVDEAMRREEDEAVTS